MRITFNTVSQKPNYKNPNYISNNNSVSFHGAKDVLVPVAAESFYTESAKKMYSKIQKYLKMLGDSGKIENVKILSETSNYYTQETRYLQSFASGSDVFLSINKSKDNAALTLSRQFSINNQTSDKQLLFNATFDKDGQMVEATFPIEGLRFNRWGNNRRHITRDDEIFTPINGNDKAWNYYGKRLASNSYIVHAKDNSTCGAFEIFLELARLKTSLYR